MLLGGPSGGYCPGSSCRSLRLARYGTPRRRPVRNAEIHRRGCLPSRPRGHCQRSIGRFEVRDQDLGEVFGGGVERAHVIACLKAAKRGTTAREDGGRQSSDGGLLLLREAKRSTGICVRLAGSVTDGRGPGRAAHSLIELIKTRPFTSSSKLRTRTFDEYTGRTRLMIATHERINRHSKHSTSRQDWPDAGATRLVCHRSRERRDPTSGSVRQRPGPEARRYRPAPRQ
jgi:DDE family transposase